MYYLQLSNGWVYLMAIMIAFTIVHVMPKIKLTNRKPFNCMPCMTGWLCLGLAAASGHNWEMCILFLISGVGIGGIVSGIIMRWL